MEGNGLTGKKDRCMKEYLERINKVLEYIEANIGSRLSLNVLADIAGFSPYHFHRIFHSIAGETLQGYVKRIRLASAAHKLLYRPDLTITEISLECGFGTPTDFARSFRAQYGMSTSSFIKAKKRKTAETGTAKRIGTIPSPQDLGQEYPAYVKLIELPDFNIAYIRRTGLSEVRRNPAIGEAFGQLINWGKAHGYTGRDTIVLGITLDSPEFTPFEECRYDACITVPEGVRPDGEIGVRRLDSKGRYAACSFGKLGPEFDRRFLDLVLPVYRWWLPDNGYLPDDRPFLEIFRTGDGPENAGMDFCIPVIPF